MKTLDDSRIKALISLLEDPSEIIFNEIHQTILFLGEDGITPLQTAFDDSESELQKERIAKILDELKLAKLNKDLNEWKEFRSEDLLAGLVLIAKYGYPNLEVSEIQTTLDAIVDSLKDKIKGKTDVEIVHLMNQVILFDFGFNGNIRDYAGIQNSFINKIFENKVGNPIGLSAIYLLVAEKLNIPLVGINSPKHFILGYVNDNFTYEDVIDGTVMENIYFYIDPFNNGLMLGVDDFDAMLLRVPYSLGDKNYLPATKIDIVKRVMNNLIYALFTTGEKDTAKELLAINKGL
jgi:regulator of sirC expression with transglutaminase-like and TPR domain